MKGALSKIYYLLVVLVAVLLIITVLPLAGNFKFLVVQSGSMEPSIKTGALVMVKPAVDYAVGDVITFGPVSKGKAPTSHRIVEVKGEGATAKYITKGDSNDAADMREVMRRDVIGKVRFDIPYLGYLLAEAQNRWGFAALVVIPAIIIIWEEGKKIIGEIKSIRSKKENSSL